MGNVNADGIWTPDEEDNLDPEVWSAVMADSISEGLGVRMANQEKKAGLKATALPTDWNFSGNFNIVPLTIGGGTDYLTEVEFTGGVATVTVPGLYTIDASITMNFGPDVPIDVTLMYNSAFEDYYALKTNATSYQTAPISTSLHLLEGDSIYIAVGVGNSQPDVAIMKYAKLSLVLQYAAE
jgi:hypothetical protein